MVLVFGPRPVLIDSGFGSDLDETEQLIRAAGVDPADLALIINTHYHCDHVGGNAGLQSRYALPIAAHPWDAALINRRGPDTGAAIWLDQPIEPYTVSRALADGEEIDTGTVRLRVLYTPGHTLGHLALYQPDDGILICGDAVHADDAAWLNPFREGPGALDRGLATLDRLARLPLRWGISGHGPPMTDPLAAISVAQQRYFSWAREPQRLAWHACKRIFAYRLMLVGGLAEAEVMPYLLTCPWYLDYCRDYFQADPAAFVPTLLAEMVRSQAARWESGRLVAGAPFVPLTGDWEPLPATTPLNWPAATPRFSYVARGIVPLLPLFLRLRRRGWSGLRTILDAHAIPPDALFLLLAMTEEVDATTVLTRAELRERLFNPYIAHEPEVFAALPGMVARGFLAGNDAGYRVTPAGFHVAQALEESARAQLAHLRPLPIAELATLADDLAILAAALWDAPEPIAKPHQTRMRHRLVTTHDTAPLVRSEAAIAALWLARDDAHMAAWRAADYSGPVVDVLSRIWTGEARNEEALVRILAATQSPADIAQSLATLSARQEITRSDGAIALTPAGLASRRAIETATDRVFFAPWPTDDAWLSGIFSRLGILCSRLETGITA